jgi:pimeloyl-CoA synthetase
MGKVYSMTRISYCKSFVDDHIEFSNLMMTKDGDVIFIEIDFNSSTLKIKNLDEGQEISIIEFSSSEDAKKKARAIVIEMGVLLNEEVREKGDL